MKGAALKERKRDQEENMKAKKEALESEAAAETDRKQQEETETALH